jgi:hypothetical protein
VYKRVSKEILKEDIFLIYFGDHEMANYVREQRAAYGHSAKTHIVPLYFHELPAYKYYEAICANRANPINDEWETPGYSPIFFTTIHSKLFLLEMVASSPHLNVFKSNYFAWIDFGLFHLKDGYAHSFQHVNGDLYKDIDDSWMPDRVKIALISPFYDVQDPLMSNKEFCAKNRHLTNGAMFGGSKESVLWFADQAHKTFRSILSDGCLVNEEGLFARIFIQNPERFDPAACYYATTLPNFACYRSGPERIFQFLNHLYSLGCYAQVERICWKALVGLRRRFITFNKEELKTLFHYYVSSLEHVAPEKVRYAQYEAAHYTDGTVGSPGPWTYTHGADSLYGDIRRVDGVFTLGDVFKAAVEAPGCVGFTTTGWLKHTVRSPLSYGGYARDEGVFVKTPPSLRVHEL